MYEQVFAQLAPLGEAALADGARVVALAAVDHLVAPQRLLAAVLACTALAHQALACVNL